jgi:hypothetical protein
VESDEISLSRRGQGRPERGTQDYRESGSGRSVGPQALNKVIQATVKGYSGDGLAHQYAGRSSEKQEERYVLWRCVRPGVGLGVGTGVAIGVGTS